MKIRIEKAKRDAVNEFFSFSENCQNINTANAQIWIFLNNFKCKVDLSSSLDFLLSPASRDVFAGSLA